MNFVKTLFSNPYTMIVSIVTLVTLSVGGVKYVYDQGYSTGYETRSEEVSDAVNRQLTSQLEHIVELNEKNLAELVLLQEKNNFISRELRENTDTTIQRIEEKLDETKITVDVNDNCSISFDVVSLLNETGGNPSSTESD